MVLRGFQLNRQFQSFGNWVTKFVVNGRPYGGSYDAAADDRLKVFFREFPSFERVLELGCLEGGHTFPIAKRAKEVVAIDSRAVNLEKAKWLAEDVFKVSNIEFVERNLETTDLDDLGPFDVCFNVGVLYHLPEPWILLDRISTCCKAMFMWTHYAPAHDAGVNREGYNGTMYREFGVEEPLSGMSERSFWPTLDELRRMLREHGFTNEVILQDEDDHPHGPAVLLRCESTAFKNPRG